MGFGMPLKYMSTASGYVQARSHFSLVEAATTFKVRKVRPKMRMRKIPGVILDHKKRYYPGVKSADQLFFDPRPRVTLVTPKVMVSRRILTLGMLNSHVRTVTNLARV